MNTPTTRTIVFKVRLPVRLNLEGNQWQASLWSMSVADVGHSPTVINTNNDATLLKYRYTFTSRYQDSNTDILFQQYAKAFSKNQSKEILSTLQKSDLQDAPNGFEFMGKVFRWMEQDLNQQLPTGYAYTDALDFWRMTITAEDNYTTWLLRFTDINPTNKKSVPYFAINLLLAQRMGWIKETASSVYDVRSNLIMELQNNQTTVKPDPATYKNSQFTFTKPIHVANGLVYLSSTFLWRFVNLNEAFDKVIRQPYETPKTESNVFKPWMTNLKLWKTVSGLDLEDSFVDLPVSSHYWKPTTLSVSLLEGVKIVVGVSKGEYNGELEIVMSSLTQNKSYTVALEWHQKDAWLFKGLEVKYLTIQKHTHEQNKTRLNYYHTLTIQFTKSVRDDATLNIKFEIGYPLLGKYPDELKDNTFLVLYGVEGHVEHVPDVYDDHPVIRTTQPTTETITTSTGDKKASTTPKNHGQVNTRPLFLSCNLTKSVYGYNTVMKTVAYKNENTLIECNPLQFYSLRSHLVDILEVTLTEWNKRIPDCNQDSPVILPCFFKKNLEEFQRKYNRIEESVDRALPV